VLKRCDSGSGGHSGTREHRYADMATVYCQRRTDAAGNAAAILRENGAVAIHFRHILD
jgi:hypothetical protein